MARKTDDPLSMESRPLKQEKQDEDAVVRLARERVVMAQGAWDVNFDRAEDDVLFAEGENQWGSLIKAAREDAHQPCLTLNNLPAMIDRITGEMRQNKHAIHVHPGDDAGERLMFQQGKAGRKVKGATILEGIIRAIEHNSNAEAHYDRAGQHSVDGGFGFLRVFTRYANNKDFDQEIIITSVRDRWSVLIDHQREQPDYSDARFAFIGSTMLRSEFDQRYPDARVGDLVEMGEYAKYWGSEERIRVAEYFTREAHERELVLLSNGQTAYMDEIEDDVRGLKAQGIEIVRSRKVVVWCVYWRKITAWSVLEGPIKLPFKTIPIVPWLGRSRDMRDGSTIYSGAIRHAKDAKRMDNYWMSAATERVALAPKAQWIGPIEAFEGYEQFWANANTASYPYMPFGGQIAPTRERPPDMPVAELQIAGQMSDRVKDTIGIHDASIGAASNETSGVAINARDRQSSTTTYVYSDNGKMAIRRIGLLLIDAIPSIYDNERIMRLRNEDGTGDWITVNQAVPEMDDQGQPVLDEKGNPKMVVINSLGSGEFDVTVIPGPAFLTQRQEASESMMQLLQISPELAPVIGDVMVEAMDWPQADKIAGRIRRTIDPKLLTQAEKEELEEDKAPQEVDPQTGEPIPAQQSPEEQMQAAQMQLAQADIQAKMAEAQAKVKDAEAKTQVAAMNMQKAQADMAASAGQPQAEQAKLALEQQKFQAEMREAQAELAIKQREGEARIKLLTAQTAKVLAEITAAGEQLKMQGQTMREQSGREERKLSHDMQRSAADGDRADREIEVKAKATGAGSEPGKAGGSNVVPMKERPKKPKRIVNVTDHDERGRIRRFEIEDAE